MVILLIYARDSEMLQRRQHVYLSQRDGVNTHAAAAVGEEIPHVST